MEFTIWKVSHQSGEYSPWFTYSIRPSGNDSIPIILDHSKFVRLFPEVDFELIPTAPEIGTIEIQVRLK